MSSAPTTAAVSSMAVPGWSDDEESSAPLEPSPAGAFGPPLGRRAFIAGTAGAVGGAALLEAPPATAAEPAFSAFQVVTPTRLVDSRPEEGDFGYTRIDDRVIRVQVTGREINGSTDTVPEEATAAVFTLVGLNRSLAGNFLSAYPTGTNWPGTANLNMTGWNDVSPNLVTVRLGRGGAVDIYGQWGAEIVLDLVGVYVPTGGEAVRAGRYRLLSSVRRVLDTRETGPAPRAGDVVRVDLTWLRNRGVLDEGAIAVSANITATQANRGFIAAYPFGTSWPGTSTLNVAQGATRGIGTMVQLGEEDGRVGFNVLIEAGAHLVVDIGGFMTGESSARSTTGQFVAIDPSRELDTRQQENGATRLWPGWTTAFTLPAAYAQKAQAVAMNLAVTQTMGAGWFTVLGAQETRAFVSNLNVTGPNQTLSNHVITAISTKGIECYSSGGGDVICDIVGWYKASSFGPSTIDIGGPPINPDPPPIAPPYLMNAPRIGLSRSMINGDSRQVVDRGLVWHWAGTGIVGSKSAISAFAHRTDAGGPLRNVHLMGPGDQVVLFTTDQRKYTYEYFDRVLTSDNPVEILNATRIANGFETVALIACTVGFDSSKSAYPDVWAPTSLKYRIIVRFLFAGWEDVRAPS